MNRVILLVFSKIKSIFQRSISFSSQVEYSTISGKARVWGHCKVYHSSLDDYSYLGRNSRLIHAHVGKFCSIAGGAQIGMGKHPLDYISTSSLFTSQRNSTGSSWSNINAFEEYEDIIIGNDVWIGSTVKVMPGVHIGNGAVVGAGALVTKDVPAYAIVGGVPSKIIRYRFSNEIITKLEESRWWTLPDDIIKRNIMIFQEPLNDYTLEKLMEIVKNNENK